MAFVGQDGPVVLEEGITGDLISTECRDAALDLMAGAAEGWSKEDLARWLTGPYAHATRHVKPTTTPPPDRPGAPAHGVGPMPPEPARTRTRTAPIDEESVEQLLTKVRGQIVAMLENVALSGHFDRREVREAIDLGHVRRVTDEEGLELWVPVDRRPMKLRDRVRSLFVADALNAPRTYERFLYVCPRCEAVVFDAGARRRGMCSAHRSRSGIVPR